MYIRQTMLIVALLVILMMVVLNVYGVIVGRVNLLEFILTNLTLLGAASLAMYYGRIVKC